MQPQLPHSCSSTTTLTQVYPHPTYVVTLYILRILSIKAYTIFNVSLLMYPC